MSAPATTGLYGKLPSHGDFVRRNLPGSLVDAVDDWLQVELARAADPGAVIAAITPLRLATTALAEGQIAVGAMIASHDRVGRDFPLLAVRLTPHPAHAFPETLPDAWDDWAGRAEATLTAARDGGWTADAAVAALDAASRSALAATSAPPPFAVAGLAGAATMVWRPATLDGPRDLTVSPGLPRGADFDLLAGARVTL